MKKFNLPMLCIFVMAIVLTPGYAFAQNDKEAVKADAIKELVSGQAYTFKAQTVTPLSGRFQQLTTEYDMQVNKNVIDAHLPYFGRAYSAPINSSDAGIQFTSKDFQYTSTNKKKGGWDINIKFKDTRDVKQMQLNIFSNGTASLQVISNNRQSISYTGYIAPATQQK